MDKSLPLSMKCAAIRKKLSAFDDGEVSPAWRSAIEAHLAVCPDCRKAITNLRRLWLAMEDVVSPLPQPGFSLGIMRRITDKPKSRLFTWRQALEII